MENHHIPQSGRHSIDNHQSGEINQITVAQLLARDASQIELSVMPIESDNSDSISETSRDSIESSASMSPEYAAIIADMQDKGRFEKTTTRDKLGTVKEKLSKKFETFKNKLPTKRLLGRRALIAAGTGLALTGVVAGAANADVNIVAGGRGDTSSQGLAGATNWMKTPGTKNLVSSPASVKTPFTPGDKMTLDENSAIVSQSVYDKYKQAGPQNVNVTSYSAGTVGTRLAIDRIVKENGGKLPANLKNVTFYSSPETNTGLFNTSYAAALKPIFKASGATIGGQIPRGTTAAAYDGDPFSNADVPLTTLVSNFAGFAAGDAHATPRPGDRYVENVVDGVTYRTYYHKGVQNEALRAAQQHGYLVTPEADAFASAIAPKGEIGVKGSAKIDGNQVLKTGANFLDDTARRAGLGDPNLRKAVGNIPGDPVGQALNAVLKTFPEQAANTIAGKPIQVPLRNVAPQQNAAPQADPVQQFVNQAQQIFIPKQAPAKINVNKPAAAPAPGIDVNKVRQQIEGGWNNLVRSIAPR